MLTDEEIEAAKKTAPYSSLEPHHEHNDCIRIAYEWLDAQNKTAGKIKRFLPLKHIIEKWGSRYVSQTDVELAAYMHDGIHGKYPYYNISSKLTLPSLDRLKGISEANTQDYGKLFKEDPYSIKE